MPVDVGFEPGPVTATNQDGDPVTVAFEDPTVLYFYPRDGSPGCTTEAEQFELERESYRDAGVAVYGVSADGIDSHREFHRELGLSFDLLSDPDGDLADLFGVERGPGGEEYERTTFLLADGEVRRVYEGVSADGHAREVLADALDEGIADLDF